MRKRLFFPALAFILAAAGSAAFAQTPDLSGEWKLNPGRSDLGEMANINPEIDLSIRQDGEAITVGKTITIMGKTMVKKFRYTLDGKESLNAGESLKDLKGKAVFENGVLIIRSEQEGMELTPSGNEQPDVKYFKIDSTEEFSLSADGKTLTVIQRGQLPDGPRKTTFVFEKTGRPK
jgi:hypothetical protein